MRSIGFHSSKGILRFVVLDGSRSAPTVFTHDRRPLQLLDDRPQFVRNAYNLFESILNLYNPDSVAYLLTMNANSQDQIAGLIMPYGALNLLSISSGRKCSEAIIANFSKKFFQNRSAVWDGDKYSSADLVFGVHAPNWTNSERSAALAAWSAM